MSSNKYNNTICREWEHSLQNPGNMKKMQTLLWHFLLLLSVACGKNDTNPTGTQSFPTNQPVPSFRNNYIETDKAAYNPGDVITFTMESVSVPENAKVRYSYLGDVVEEQAFTGSSWTWKAPSQDFTAYLVEVYSKENDTETIYASIAVDVSSSWTKFPRYGFLSSYVALSDETIESVISNLNRHHINGIQFFDWHHKHHQPLPLNGGTPPAVWKSIGNRDNYFSTEEKYIEQAHNHNMKAMFYNLVYGAWENAEQDGVLPEWYIFKDANHVNREVMTLPKPPFLSNIFLLDPSNTGWQSYINNENKKVYQFLDFDGYHMDQLGDWGLHYTYDGKELYLDQAFKPFIESAKASEPDKYIVMNAVNQYGQQEIATAPSDFLYTEVWDPSITYNDLSVVIRNNNTYSGHTKNSVLAAYMDYDLAENQGYFNTPGVLMTEAVIFAFGGAHLELGEHMLGKEYFPNNNLKMKPELKEALVHYYDFLVAYQNLLRDGGSFNTLKVTSADTRIQISNWPAGPGSIAAVSKKVDNRQLVHLINFKDANSMEWRDKNGTQSEPGLLKDLPVSIQVSEPVSRLWIASPDMAGGTSMPLNFVQKNGEILFTLPRLKYWSMLVLEFE